MEKENLRKLKRLIDESFDHDGIYHDDRKVDLRRRGSNKEIRIYHEESDAVALLDDSGYLRMIRDESGGCYLAERVLLCVEWSMMFSEQGDLLVAADINYPGRHHII